MKGGGSTIKVISEESREELYASKLDNLGKMDKSLERNPT